MSAGTELQPFDPNTQQVRRVWHQGRWYFSVVDLCAVLTGSTNPGHYWRVLKSRLSTEEGASQTVSKCDALKLPAADGKQRLTDCADLETLLRIVQSIPSPRAEPVKAWLAAVGSQTLEEAESPTLADDRTREHYAKQGYPPDWIERRMQSMNTRQELTDEWHDRGAEPGRDYARLTDVLSRGTFDMTTDQHKAYKSLRPRGNLRDSMTTLELALVTLVEETSKALHQTRDSQGYGALANDAREAGAIGGATRREIEASTGQPVASPENYRTLRQPATQPRLLTSEGE